MISEGRIGPVVCVEGDDEKSIVAPGLRLRFSRLDDRWTHAIDIGPAPWQVMAEAVEWASAAETPDRVVSPTYQDVHFQQDNGSVLALLIGQAGPHHFSASVRVSQRYYDHEVNKSWTTEHSFIEFDVADRCRAVLNALECNYFVHKPPVLYMLDNGLRHGKPPLSTVEMIGRLDEGVDRDWRYVLAWETTSGATWDVRVEAFDPHEGQTVVALIDETERGWPVRVSPVSLVPHGTSRIRYGWSHTRKSFQ